MVESWCALTCLLLLVAAPTTLAQTTGTVNWNGAAHDYLTQTFNLWSTLLDKWFPAAAVSTATTAESGTSGGTESAGRQTKPNPFIGAAFYVNPDFAKNADASLAKYAAGSAEAKMIKTVQGISTGIWLDRIDAIKGGAANGGRLSLTQHFDEALKQAAAAGKPVVVPIVVYDLPNRDCAALASNGELGPDDLPKYESLYIDAIARAITAKPAYASLRIVAIVEPDSLPNMVTNLAVPSCARVKAQSTYFKGITYAIQKLGVIDSVSIYLDIAHSGWLGWRDNLAAAVGQYADLITKAEAGGDALVRGLATDIANYTPLVEPFLTPNNITALSSSFYEWNPVFDETTYVSSLSAAFNAAGIPGLGFVVDTSRSGWAAVDDGTPIDNRKARGNWCNVNGAGMGQPPRATPSSTLPIDAFVWIKPPGESDGSGQVTTPGNVPDAEGKRFDTSCDPMNLATDAMASAPPAGKWFHEQFMALIKNANPPIATGPIQAPGGASTAGTPAPTMRRPTARLTPAPTPQPTTRRAATASTPAPTQRATPRPTPKATAAAAATPRPTAKVVSTPKPTPKPTPSRRATINPAQRPGAVTASPGSSAGTIGTYAQCGGKSGPNTNAPPLLGDFAWSDNGGSGCVAGNVCTRQNEWYWQCLAN